MKINSIAFAVLLILTTQARAEKQQVDPEATSAGQEFLLRAGEYAGFQIEATQGLSNQQLAWTLPDGATGEITIGSDGKIAEFRSPQNSNEVSAEIFELAEALFYTSFPLDDGRRALTLIVDRLNGRVIEIESRRPGANEDTHRAQVKIREGKLQSAENDLEPLSATERMAGVRLTAHYSEEIAYEHIYLNAHRVTWHGVTGPEAGIADTEYYDAYELRDDIYLVSWSEKVLTTHMIFLFNFDTGHEIGTIFGYEPEHDKAVIETIGAKTDVVQGPSH